MVVHLLDGTYELFRHFYGRRRGGSDRRLGAASGVLHTVLETMEQGATHIVDLATLTGAVVIALGSTYAAVISNDDELAAAVSEAGARSGELPWRLPLHAEYKELMKGTVADLSNLASKRKAGTITAAAFLEEFVGDTPWAHVDIAGTAWDVGREYTGNDASGYGVRLLVELAREIAA